MHLRILALATLVATSRTSCVKKILNELQYKHSGILGRFLQVYIFFRSSQLKAWQTVNKGINITPAALHRHILI